MVITCNWNIRIILWDTQRSVKKANTKPCSGTEETDIAPTVSPVLLNHKGLYLRENDKNSAFILMINLFIIQGCQSGSVGQVGLVV